MRRRSLVFQGPRLLEIETSEMPVAGPGEVLVAAEASAISAGTELLVYRGQAPGEASSPAEVPALRQGFGFPMQFGYSMVGRVIDGEKDWIGRRIFAFHPHESHFVAPVEGLLELPGDPENGVFLPNLESAVNFVHDGRPLMGERVLVLGQGIVGLLTTALLRRFPLAELVTVDPVPVRRQRSQGLGARSLAPEECDFAGHFDLVFELSGNPLSLNRAIAACRFGGRVVIGSWYGSKRAEIDLGGTFHRNRIQLLSSQVSTLDPALTGCWDKARRLQLAQDSLAEVLPQQFITQRFDLEEAARAYELLDRHPEQALQVVLQYPAC
ncbi:MAG: zinc-binding alcohol dehydrogenase [Candidatus Eremiobacteraeota bacterium]|nr:zinc-binding alcohol dehydrogenase [Candidatus Eremiobacteraeota bacterium]